MLEKIRRLVKGSTDSLLRTDRGNQLIRGLETLKKVRVNVGGAGGSRFETSEEGSVLSITQPDLIRALPSGAGVNVTFSQSPPSGGQDGDIWISTNPNAPILTMYSAPLFFIGSLVLNQIFGYFSPAQAATVSGAQVFMQTPPTGADAVFTLVDGTGTSLGVTVTCPAGQTTGSGTFTLSLAAGAVVQAKITQIGSTASGGYATVVLNVT